MHEKSKKSTMTSVVENTIFNGTEVGKNFNLFFSLSGMLFFLLVFPLHTNRNQVQLFGT